MGANEKLTLQIDTQTTGQQQVDALTASLNKVVNIADKAGQSGSAFSSFPSAVKQFVQDPLASAESSLTSFASGFGPVGIGIAGTIAGLSALAVASASATRSLADLGIQTSNIALRTGLTTKEVGQFSFAARANGSDIDAFSSAMRKLSEGLVDSGEGGKKARESLSALHVQTRQLNGELKPTSQLFEEIGDALGGITSAALRDKLAIDLFGRSALELIPTLIGLRANLKRSDELGIGISDAEITKMKGYQQRIAEVDAIWEKAKRHISEGIAGNIWLDIKGSAAGLLEILAGNHPSAPVASEAQTNALRQSQGLPPLPPASSTDRFASLLSFEGTSTGAAQIARDANDTSTLAGAQHALQAAKEKADKLRNEYLGSEGAANSVVAEKRKAWQDAEAAAKRYEETVKLLTKTEAEHLAVLEQMRKLSQEGEGYYVIGSSGPLQTVVGKSEIELSKPRSAPSIYRTGEYDPERAAFAENAYSDLPSGMQYVPTGREFTGHVGSSKSDRDELDALARQIVELHKSDAEEDIAKAKKLDTLYQVKSAAIDKQYQLNGPESAFAFVSPSADRTGEGSGGDLMADARLKAQADRDEKEGQIKLDQLRAETDATARIFELRAGPGGEFEAAEKTAALRLQAAQEEFNLTGDIVALENERTKLAVDRQVRIAELQAKDIADFRSFTGSVFDAIASRQPRALPDLLKSTGLGIARTVTENAAQQYLFPTIQQLTPHLSGAIGNLAKGTPFGPDPLHASATTFDTAAVTFSAAVDRFTTMSPSGGGGGLVSGDAGTPSAVTDAFGNVIPSLPPAALSGTGLAALARSSGASSLLGNFGSGAGSVASGYALSVALDPGFNAATRIGAGVGIAGALAAGGEGIYSGLKQGGVGGDLKAAGSAAGLAGGIISNVSKLLNVASPLLSAIPIVGSIAALALPLLGGLFNGPQQRANAINQELSSAQYQAPTALNVTQSSSGTFTDFDARGNIRTSDLSPYPTTTNPYLWEQTHGFFGPPPTYYQVPGGQTSQFGAPVSAPQAPAAPQLVVNVSAIDTQSGLDFIDRNHMAISGAAAKGLQNMHSAFTAEVQRAANP